MFDMMRGPSIIHVGAGKCGSTTIQQYLSANEKHLGISSYILEHQFIHQLEVEFIHGGLGPAHAHAQKMIEAGLHKSGRIFISNEYLFSRPTAAAALALIIKNIGIGDIVVCGYIRKQSQWLRSAYWQWLQYSPYLHGLTKKSLKLREEIDVLDCYSAIERENSYISLDLSRDFFITRAMVRNHLDWSHGLSQLAGELECVFTDSDRLRFSFGVLDKEHLVNESLVEDFATRTGLKVVSGQETLACNSRGKPPPPAISKSSEGPQSQDLALRLKSIKDDATRLDMLVDNHFIESNRYICERYKISWSSLMPGKLID